MNSPYPHVHKDWVIIGGGIHGVHVAARLIGEVGLARDRLCIVDPGDQLLDRWRTCTAQTGMTFLRSPSVHHLGLSPWSLEKFAGKKSKRPKGLFARPYNRPSLALFNAHCDRVIEDLGLDACHLRARVTDAAIVDDDVTMRLSDGRTLHADRVVLAIGGGEHPELPSWMPTHDSRAQHIFAKSFNGWPIEHEAVVVVGGGISAGQVALRLASEGHDVHLICRHPFRKHQFDSDAGWLGPKFMRGFQQEPCASARRAMITRARHRGSMPPDVVRDVKHAIHTGMIAHHQSDVDRLTADPTSLHLTLTNGVSIPADRVLLATGFRGSRPGGTLIDGLITSASLPCASCGFPLVDTSLRWHPRVFVTGPLAELELGPTSRNIAGARRAADRMVHALRAESL